MITDAGVLKVGDFGQARPLVATEGGGDFSHQISTRWYRSPELLFGARSYTTAIALWAVGVVLAENLHAYVLFEGRSAIEQLLGVDYNDRPSLGIGKPFLFCWGHRCSF